MTTSVRRARAIDGAEHDAVCEYCRPHRNFRPGVRSKIKHKINRRERQQAKTALRRDGLTTLR